MRKIKILNPVMIKQKKLFILGVGHNTAVFIELAETLGYSISGLYHYQNDRIGEQFCGFPIVGCNQELFEMKDLSDRNFALSMGNNAIRANLSEEIRKRGGNIPKLVHPMASVSKYSSLEEGVVVHANAIVQPNVKIEKDSVVSFNAGVTHDVIIESAVYVAGGSITGAYAHVHHGALIGMGSVIISDKVRNIGKHAIVGAGAVVSKDVEPYTIVAGNPAKVIGRIKL